MSDSSGLIAVIFGDVDFFQRNLCQKLMNIQFQKYSMEIDTVKSLNKKLSVSKDNLQKRVNLLDSKCRQQKAELDNIYQMRQKKVEGVSPQKPSQSISATPTHNKNTLSGLLNRSRSQNKVENVQKEPIPEREPYRPPMPANNPFGTRNAAPQ